MCKFNEDWKSVHQLRSLDEPFNFSEQKIDQQILSHFTYLIFFILIDIVLYLQLVECHACRTVELKMPLF